MRKFVRVVPHTDVITVDGLIAKGYHPEEAKKYAYDAPRFWDLAVITEAEVRKIVKEEFDVCANEAAYSELIDVYGADDPQDVLLEKALDVISLIRVGDVFYNQARTWIEITEEV